MRYFSKRITNEIEAATVRKQFERGLQLLSDVRNANNESISSKAWLEEQENEIRDVVDDLIVSFLPDKATLSDPRVRDCEKAAVAKRAAFLPPPLELLLYCPECRERHIDVGEWATKAHHTHACQLCGFVWRPAVEPTVGVQFLRGFRNES